MWLWFWSGFNIWTLFYAGYINVASSIVTRRCCTLPLKWCNLAVLHPISSPSSAAPYFLTLQCNILETMSCPSQEELPALELHTLGYALISTPPMFLLQCCTLHPVAWPCSAVPCNVPCSDVTLWPCDICHNPVVLHVLPLPCSAELKHLS